MTMTTNPSSPLSAPVGVEGLIRLLERIRDLLASLPVDCLGSGTGANGQPYPIRDEVIHGITKALTSPPVAVDDMVVERIATLLHEEATAEPWTVAGVEHPGPDRDYYRGLARKVAALAAQQQGGSDDA